MRKTSIYLSDEQADHLARLAQAEGRASLGPNGGAYDLDWLETSEPNWDAFTGHWRAIAPAGGGSGTWCAWRNNANPPC